MECENIFDSLDCKLCTDKNVCIHYVNSLNKLLKGVNTECCACVDIIDSIKFGHIVCLNKFLEDRWYDVEWNDDDDPFYAFKGLMSIHDPKNIPFLYAIKHSTPKIINILLNSGYGINNKHNASFLLKLASGVSVDAFNIIKNYFEEMESLMVYRFGELRDKHEIKKYLEDNPNIINARGPKKATPLISSVECDEKYKVKLLLKCDNLNTFLKDRDDHTALWKACRYHRWDCLKLLLKSGKLYNEDINDIKHKFGKSAYIINMIEGYTSLDIKEPSED